MSYKCCSLGCPLLSYGSSQQQSPRAPETVGAPVRKGDNCRTARAPPTRRPPRLIEEIGGGSFGRVFRAKWHETVVAVKILLNVAGAEGSAEGGSDRPLTLSNPALANLQKGAHWEMDAGERDGCWGNAVAASIPCGVENEMA